MGYENSPELGLLRYFKYQVGKNGYKKDWRHKQLTILFKDLLNDYYIKRKFDANHLYLWGAPKTNQRLLKMISVINELRNSAVTRAELSKTNGLDVAIAEWSEDLEWLEEKKSEWL